jgi:mannose-6-phosphate isomerase-like protein (cupin superfamily)
MDLEALTKLRPSLLSLKIPLLSMGMSKDLLCRGENSTFRIHCYSTGMGEKHGLHAHVEEEHVFVVLHGCAHFSDLDGKLPVIGANEGIWIPKGCFYEFINPGPDPLVVLRFGALQEGANESKRIDPKGEKILGRASQDPERARPSVIEGLFFGEPQSTKGEHV